MKNTFSLQQISRTSNLDAILISRQFKINLMDDFIRVEYENPKLKQIGIANHLVYSTRFLQRYRNDINMVSPYRIQPNKTKNWAKKGLQKLIFTTIHFVTLTLKGLKRPQMTSKRPQTNQLKLREIN